MTFAVDSDVRRKNYCGIYVKQEFKSFKISTVISAYTLMLCFILFAAIFVIIVFIIVIVAVIVTVVVVLVTVAD